MTCSGITYLISNPEVPELQFKRSTDLSASGADPPLKYKIHTYAGEMAVFDLPCLQPEVLPMPFPVIHRRWSPVNAESYRSI